LRSPLWEPLFQYALLLQETDSESGAIPLRKAVPADIREFSKRVERGRILTGKSDRAIYSHDLGEIPPRLMNLLFGSLPACVIQPATEEEAAEAIRYARTRGIAVITRTTASSGFGNVIPTKGEVVIDVGALKEILDLDRSAPSITVQAGARWADVETFLNSEGLAFSTYPSSYYSSVGGWIATGGLGINSLGFGHLKRHVLAMRVVFPTGEVRELLPSDHWFDRFFGTEGQFGLITRVCLKVRQRPEGIFPALLSFDGEVEAFRWMGSLTGTDKACNHAKLMDPLIAAEINRFYGEPLLEPRYSVLAVFEKSGDREKLTPGPGRKEPDHLARFLWHERLFPLRLSRVGSALLASETLLQERAAVPYLARARLLARRLGFDLLVEAHAVGPRLLLMMPHFFCEPTRPLRYSLALVFTSLLTQMAVDSGGIPYGLGLWNSPFIGRRFDALSLKALKEWKARVDPNHRFNPSRFFGFGTRFVDLPPWFFRALMRTLVFTSPLWSGPAGLLCSGGPARVRTFTPMEKAALLCSRCGSCLSACPAYLVTGDEALTARSKLGLIRRMLNGEPSCPEELQKVFLCLHCRGCERVCQSRLGLVEAWKELEERVARTYGTPQDRVARFMKEIDGSDEYERMVDRW